MSRWPRGEAEVEQLVARRELELVAGAGADGTPLLAQASKDGSDGCRRGPAAMPTALTSWPTTPHGSPASLSWPSKACALLPAEVTTPLSARSEPSSERVSGRSQTFDGAATSWNILTYPETRPRRTKLNKLLRSQNALLLRLTSCLASSLSSPSRKDHELLVGASAVCGVAGERAYRGQQSRAAPGAGRVTAAEPRGGGGLPAGGAAAARC